MVYFCHCMKRVFIKIAIAVIGVVNVCTAQQLQVANLQNGDLLFQNIDCGPLCDAIEKVTSGYKGNDFSHIGLVYRRNDSVYVIEAIGKDVHLTPIQDFAARTTHPMYVAALKPAYKKLNKQALKYALQQQGVPYDDVFLYNNGKYYCSELIYDAYKNANGNKPFFRLEPMTFKQPGTTQYFDAWVKYYEELKTAIPEGKKGINPGGISRSDKILIKGTL